MQYLLVALLSLFAYPSFAGLVTVHYDNKTLIAEGVVFVGSVGSVGDFTVLESVVTTEDPSDPFVEGYYPNWSGFFNFTDPNTPPQAIGPGCRLARMQAADQGNILISIDCRSSTTIAVSLRTVPQVFVYEVVNRVDVGTSVSADIVDRTILPNTRLFADGFEGEIVLTLRGIDFVVTYVNCQMDPADITHFLCESPI